MRTAIFILVVIATLGVAAVPYAAYGSVDLASNGLEIADEKVHENTGAVSDQDVRFHEDLCQGGHTTEALEGLGGCDVLTDPGESDDNRQDDDDDDDDDE
jgi:hypothetical protein